MLLCYTRKYIESFNNSIYSSPSSSFDKDTQKTKNPTLTVVATQRSDDYILDPEDRSIRSCISERFFSLSSSSLGSEPDNHHDCCDDTETSANIFEDEDYELSYDDALIAIMEKYKTNSNNLKDNHRATTTSDFDDGNHDIPFLILGTSSSYDGDDEPDNGSSRKLLQTQQQPHVLSPPIMESLRSFFPYFKKSDNFFLRYSLVRDGASMQTFLEKARGAKYSIIAVETIHGEVFGSFTSEPWRKMCKTSFGNGESFLWKLNHCRDIHAIEQAQLRKQGKNENSIISGNRQWSLIQDIIQKENEINVYPYGGENDIVQICDHDKIAVGGGTTASSSMAHETFPFQLQENNNNCGFGYGLCIQNDMRHGTTSPCITFGSSSLSKNHADGSLFEIRNLELWSLTPCTREKDAEQMEKMRSALFQTNNSTRIHHSSSIFY